MQTAVAREARRKPRAVLGALSEVSAALLALSSLFGFSAAAQVPATCVITGTVLNGQSQPVPNTPVRMRTVVPTAFGNYGITNQDLVVYTDASGNWSQTVTQGLKAQIDIPAVALYNDIIVPSGASCPATFSSLTLYTRGTLTPATIISQTGPAFGGDLTGNSPNPSVVGFRGTPLIAGTPTNGQAWIYSSASQGFTLQSPLSGSFSPSSDVQILQTANATSGTQQQSSFKLELTGSVWNVGAGQAETRLFSIRNVPTGFNAGKISFLTYNGNGGIGAEVSNIDTSGNYNGNVVGNVTGNLTGNVTGNVTGTAASITGNLTGDVTSVGMATTVAQVGGYSAANVAAGATLANAATNNNTASTIVKRDSSGNFTAGTITAALTGNASGSAASFTGSLVGDVTGTQGATVVGKLQGRAVSSTAPTNTYVLTWVSGNSDWEPATTNNAVSSVGGSGGTTGLTLSGGPTGAVTLTLGGTLAVANGGTGSGTANAGFANLSPLTTLGDLIYENATPTPARLAGSTSATKNFLTQTGTGVISAAPAWGTIQAADIPSPISANTSGTAANVTGTVAIANGGTGQTTAGPAYNALAPTTTLGDLAYANGAGTNTRLAGNTTTTSKYLNSTGTGAAANAPTWNAIAATDLPGSITSNTSGTAGNVTGTVAIGNGGTGQVAANAGFNALAPLTTLGDVIYEDATPKAVRLAGSTSATKQFLTQTGNGTISAAPAWGGIVSGDLPATIAANTTGTAASFTGNLTGDATSTGMATSVVKIQGRAVSSTAPTNNYVLTWVSGNSDWEPQPAGASSVTSVSGSGGTTGLTLSGGPTGAVTLTLGGTLVVANGGTGAATANAGFNALSPLSTVGDILYENSTPAGARLAGNSTTTKQFLTSTGTGAAAQAPAWGGIVSADLPATIAANTTGTAANVTGTVVVGNGGTGATTLTGLLHGNGVSAVTAGAASLTADVTGTLPVANGGTGIATAGSGGYIKGSGTSAFTVQATPIPVTDGGTGAATLSGVLHGNGTSAVTASQASLTADVTGILPVANGGTGVATIPSGAFLTGNGTGAITTQALPITVAQGGTGATTLTGILSGNGTSAVTGGTLVGLTTQVSGTLPIANGGTGQTTQQAALNALMPGSPAKGDLAAYTGSNWVRQPVGADGTILTAASAQTNGIQWQVSPWVSVKTYGAVGDGTTDDTTAIQNAINANCNGSVYFPGATYKYSTLSITCNIRLFGDGMKSSTLSTTTTAADAIVVSGSAAQGTLVVVFESLGFTAASQQTAGSIIHLNTTNGNAIRVYRCAFFNYWNALYLSTAQACVISDDFFWTSTGNAGIYVDNTINPDMAFGIVTNCWFTALTTYGIRAQRGCSSNIIGDYFINGMSYPLYFDMPASNTTSQIIIEGCHLDGFAVTGISLLTAGTLGRIQIVGNYIGSPLLSGTVGINDAPASGGAIANVLISNNTFRVFTTGVVFNATSSGGNNICSVQSNDFATPTVTGVTATANDTNISTGNNFFDSTVTTKESIPAASRAILSPAYFSTLSVGTGAPQAPITVTNNVTAPQAPPGGGTTLLQAVGVDGSSPRILFDGYGGGGFWTFRSAKNTNASPQAVDNTVALGTITALGYGSTGYGAVRNQINFAPVETWTDAAQGTRTVFSTTPATTTQTANVLFIGNDGLLTSGINEAGAAGVQYGNVPTVLFTQTANSTTTANTTTTLLGTGVNYVTNGSAVPTFPANYFVVGRTVEISMGGYVSVADGGAGTKTLSILLGGTVVATATSGATFTTVGNAAWTAHATITCRTTGSSGTVQAGGDWMTQIASASPVGVIAANTTTTTINTTSGLKPDVQFNNGNATGTVTTTYARITQLN
jgi:Pectate lyase superfamily protein